MRTPPLHLQHFIAAILLALYPFVKFISYQRYPLFSFEVFFLLGLAALLLGIYFLFCRRPLYICFLYFLILLFFVTTAPTAIKPMGLYLRAGACLLVSFVFFKVYEKLPRFLFVFILGLVLTDIVIASVPHKEGLFPWAKQSTDGSSRPDAQNVRPRDEHAPPLSHVIYLILDEHIGIEGMPEEVPETATVKESLIQFYKKNNFTLYTKAFSNYFFTDNSISNILNGTYVEVQDFYFHGSKEEERNLHKNRVFALMNEQGFLTNVYESRYINYCTQEHFIQKCFEFSPNSPLVLRALSYPTLDRMWVLSSMILGQNSIVQEIEKRMKDRNILKVRVGALSTMDKQFDALGADIQSATQNTFFFAHIFMPHYPYVLDGQCHPLPVEKWENRNEYNNGQNQNSQESYARKYALYYGQVECMEKKLNTLFTMLQEKGLYDNATIIIHGDHGSRINKEYDPYFDFYKNIGLQDMKTSFAALAAIKMPKQDSGAINDTQLDVNSLVQNTFGGENRPANMSVYLQQKHGKKELVKVPMPVF